MISSNVQAIIIKVAALGLDPDKHLGKTLDQMEPYLLELSKKYGVHVCGEGGEYETFTLDCPLFKKKIIVDSSEVVTHSADAFAPVAYLRFLELHLEDKHLTSSDRLFMGNCSCEVNCNEDNILALKEEEDQNETPPLIWKSLTPLLQNSQKSMSSGKSPSGYQWINGIIAAFLSFSEESVIIAAAQAFSSLQATIKSKRLELKDIILVRLYLKNMKDFSSINSAYVTTFKHCLPARVCVETMLPEEVLFSIDCLIHQSDIKIDDGLFHPKEILHVQNISHWAPASIGPYSQSIKSSRHCWRQRWTRWHPRWFWYL
ncbi:diphthine--ammonia ligase isoform X5 [Phocoena sinus]|nr:diphthine--ammonia ligase isoform X5 [Phocoena sinus]